MKVVVVVAFLKFRKILAVLRTSRCIFVAERTLDEGSFLVTHDCINN